MKLEGACIFSAAAKAEATTTNRRANMLPKHQHHKADSNTLSVQRQLCYACCCAGGRSKTTHLRFQWQIWLRTLTCCHGHGQAVDATHCMGDDRKQVARNGSSSRQTQGLLGPTWILNRTTNMKTVRRAACADGASDNCRARGKFRPAKAASSQWQLNSTASSGIRLCDQT